MQKNTMLAASALALMSMTAGLQADALEDISDHPLVPRIQETELIAHDHVDHDRHVIPWGPHRDGAWKETIEVDGAHERFAYILRDPDIRPLPLSVAYKSVLGLRGFEIDFLAVGRTHLPDDFSEDPHFSRDVDHHPGGAPSPDSDLDARRFFGARHADEDLYVTVFIHENAEGEPVILVSIVEP